MADQESQLEKALLQSSTSTNTSPQVAVTNEENKQTPNRTPLQSSLTSQEDTSNSSSVSKSSNLQPTFSHTTPEETSLASLFSKPITPHADTDTSQALIKTLPTSFDGFQNDPDVFKPTLASLRLPPYFFTTLQKGFAAYVTENKLGQINIKWISLLSCNLKGNAPIAPEISQTLHQLLHENISNFAQTNHNFDISQQVLDGSKLLLPYWEDDGAWPEMFEEEFGIRVFNFAWYLEERYEVHCSAHYNRIRAKFALDQMYGSPNDNTSLWNYRDWYNNSRQHIAGQAMNEDDWFNLLITWNKLDGNSHSVSYEGLAITRRQIHNHGKLWSGDAGTSFDRDTYYTYLAELDVPQVVYAAVANWQTSLHVPDLYGIAGSNARALQVRSAQYLAAHGNELSYHQNSLDVAVSIETMLCQAVFIINWRLNIRRFGEPFKRGIYDSLNFNPPPRALRCDFPGSCPRPGQPCKEFEKTMKMLEKHMVENILNNVVVWVLQLVAGGALEIVDDVNDRLERGRMMSSLVTKDIIKAVFVPLEPGVNLAQLVELPLWYKQLSTVFVRLADEVLLFQVAQKAQLDPFSAHLHQSFGDIARGRGIMSNVEIPEYSPPPLHPSLQDFAAGLALQVWDEDDEHQYTTYTVPSSFVLEEESRTQDTWLRTCVGKFVWGNPR